MTREPYERPQVTRIRLDDAMMVSVCKGRPHTPNTCWRRPAPPLQGLGS